MTNFVIAWFEDAKAYRIQAVCRICREAHVYNVSERAYPMAVRLARSGQSVCKHCKEERECKPSYLSRRPY